MCSYKMVESLGIILIVLFIGVMSAVQTGDKNCPYNHPKCKCEFFSTINCIGLQEIPPVNSGADTRFYYRVNFKNGNITSISKNSLPPGLEKVIVIGNPLTNISDDAFDASMTSLRYVLFQEAMFKRLPSALEKVTGLLTLQIIDTPIHNWDRVSLKPLQTIELKNVSLSAWPSWISDCPFLSTIELPWNSLKSVPDDAFKLNKGLLYWLDLCHTGLTHIPKALSTLTSLRILNLCSNSFTDESEFKLITGSPFNQKLSDLNLDATGLTRIPKFSALTHLEHIGLAGNRIHEVPAGSLPASLKRVNISDNRLSSLPKDIARMSKLEYLYLSNNLITVIEPKSLPLRLTFLDLQYNKLTSITNTAFENLVYLNHLDLDSNPISTIADSAFSDLGSLRLLQMRDVHLTKFPLALMELNHETMVYFTTAKSMVCPWPDSGRLLDWFRLLTDPTEIRVSCDSGLTFNTYVKTRCNQKDRF